MTQSSIVNLSDSDVRRRLDPASVIDAITAAFLRDWRATATMPQRTRLDLPGGLVLLLMPCFDSALPALGVKMVTVSPVSGADGGRVHATYSLLDPRTGELQATMAADYLTEVRTAATSAVATRLLARADAHILGIFGTGKQARAHIEVLRLVRDFERVLVCGSSPDKSKAFARSLPHDLRAEAADARTCASESDVICTCTNSPTPLFDGQWLRPGTHLNLIGAFRPDTREVDDTAVHRSRVVVDTYEAALAEAGDLLIPMNKGLIGRDHVLADLHDLLNGKAVRRSGEDITLFKSVGCALEDLVTARLLLN